MPTEAEWHYAANGGSEQRAYPRSSPASATTIYCSYEDYRWSNDPIMFCVRATQGGVIRVGDKSPEGDGRQGYSDLGGNVSESRSAGGITVNA